MTPVNKAIAGGTGAAIGKIITALIRHYIPDMGMDVMDAVEFLVYTGLTSGLVYIAPANKEKEN